MSSLNPLRRTLAEGRATLGYLVSMPSGQLVQSLARTGVEIVLSGIAFSADDARAMIACGHRFIVLGSDAGLISGAAQRMVRAIRA